MSHLDDDPNKVAEELGLQVVLPGPRDVFVDIDSEADYEWMLEMLGVLSTVELPLVFAGEYPSKSGLPRRHVYLKADRDLTPEGRIALQACLGSDRKRELLSMARIFLRTDRPPTLFFEPQGFEVPVDPGAGYKEVI